MIEPLPPVLAELFADEDAAPELLDRGARVAVRAKLAATVGAAPLGAAGVLGVTGKVLAVLAIAVGAGTWYAASHRETDEARRPPTAVVASAPPVEVASVEPAPVEMPAPMVIEPAPPTPRAAPRHSRPVRVHSRPAVEDAHAEPTVTKPAPSQAALLRDALAAFAAGDTDRALELVRSDRELHPTGELAEERDALEVQALAKTGHVTEARAAATRFLASYPDSIHRARVERDMKQLASRPTSEEP